ncbi:MAG: hypothetical protein HY063_07310 [Bacteroidetes bacterium]|nr:hypothetical protein [Bacteroidota bacterium]
MKKAKHNVGNKSSLLAACMLACCLFSVPSSFALKSVNSGSQGGGKPNAAPPTVLSGCTPGAAQADLDINNVRAHYLTGGDMWWDYSQQTHGIYEVPKGSGIMPIYAGALWIGGYDNGNNLHLAGQEYRDAGNDWWPGPLTTDGSALISADQCNAWDHHYKITQAEVTAFIGGGAATTAIQNWPGNGNAALGQAPTIAPFVDKNGDGKYNSADGDYPDFGDGTCSEVNCVPKDHISGDECLFWVINDKGNIHSETKGLPMGLEVHCQAFAFSTDDEINNMTFLSYRIYNRSSLTLDSTFIAIWCDPDLGCATDDWVGCDVERGLGYVYNGTNNDVACSGELGYGIAPPALGIDFFRGPIATPGDGKDNNHNCVVDEICEQAIMAHFVHFTNGAGYPQRDPSGAKEYYNYMSGSWQDGTPFTYGGQGYLSGGPLCAYSFPGDPCTQKTSDTHDWGTGGNCSTSQTLPYWSEASVNNTPGDRRLLESAGPFKLQPGAVNVVTAGVVWARGSDNINSVCLMKAADDKAQKLFDNCFQVLNGPDAPDITIQELDKKLILYLTNKPTSNNYNENYSEYDATIALLDASGKPLHCIDTTYDFEGYKIFQLKDNTVSASDLDNPDKARMLAQCDVKNGVSTITNYVFNAQLNAIVPSVQVTGDDKGVFHSLVVTKDLFALGDPTIVNHHTYYYMAVAYGYNQFKPYKQDATPDLSQNKCSNFTNGVANSTITATFDGQKKPYKQGRRNLHSYSGIPHNPAPYSGGTSMSAAYGSQPGITRVEGNGNGGQYLELTSATTSSILSASDNRAKSLEYVAGYGPINVKVVDPLNVPDATNFTLKFDSTARIDYQMLGGTFKVGEKIKGRTSGATGTIAFANSSRLRVTAVSGSFRLGEVIYGPGPFPNPTPTDSAKIQNYLSAPAGGSIGKSNWILINNTTGDTVWSDQTVERVYENIVPQYGISVAVLQAGEPGSAASVNNGYLSSSMTFADETKNWLTGVADINALSYANWIRSGTHITNPSKVDPWQDDYVGLDDNEIYAGVVDGTWAPYRLTARTDNAAIPATPSDHFDWSSYYGGTMFSPKINYMGTVKLSDLSSVDVVLTSDKSKWSRCVVLEMCEDSNYSVSTAPTEKYRARKLDYRKAFSVDKNGNTDTSYDFPTGMGWFPGYAINVETGERLNIAFGENSALSKVSSRKVLTYNLRGTITYAGLKGTFMNSESITAYTNGGTARVVNAGATLTIDSISGIISAGDVIVGAKSGAKATVTSFTAPTFQDAKDAPMLLNGETVTGATSLAKGDILIQNNSDNTASIAILTNVTGTFSNGEVITGGTSGAVASVISFSAYDFNQNGADMTWNPTSTKYGSAPWAMGKQASGTDPALFGGYHYIYIFGHNRDVSSVQTITVPRYDGCKQIRTTMGLNNGQPANPQLKDIYRDAMWVNIPLLNSGHSLLESDVTVRLRVAKSYKIGYSPALTVVGTKNIIADTASTAFGQNRNLPMYTFSTDGIATHTNLNDSAVSALDLINVVPNPYYAYSGYETKGVETKILITNLPEQCTISIYNLGGTLIRRIKKGEAYDPHPAFDSEVKSNALSTWDGSRYWDLKNNAGTPISSGVYIIHIEVPGVGEKILKWFGIMRPLDVGSF